MLSADSERNRRKSEKNYVQLPSSPKVRKPALFIDSNNNNNNNLFEFLKQKKNAFIMKFIDTQLILQLITDWGNTKYGEQGLGSLAEN